MPLPEDFSPAKHLLEMLLATHNRNVDRTFLGVPDNDLEHAQGGMKLACVIQEDDTVDMIILRLFLFYFAFKGNLPKPIYGIPVSDYQAELEIPSRPQVKLIFVEDYSPFLYENKLQPATAEISWRIMNQTYLTITPQYAKSLALRIKESFALENGFTWEKGVLKVVYKDLPKGCNFSLLAESKAEAIRVIEKILNFIDVPFNEHKIKVSQSDEIFSVMPRKTEIYGKVRSLPRRRPITSVRFRRAELHIYGVKEPVLLVDRLNSGEALIN